MHKWLKEGTPLTLHVLWVSWVCLYCTHFLVTHWNWRLQQLMRWSPVMWALSAFVRFTFTLPTKCHLLWQSNSKGRYDENVWLQLRWWQDATCDDLTSWKGRLVFCLILLQVASIFKFLQFWNIKEMLYTCKPLHTDQQLIYFPSGVSNITHIFLCNCRPFRGKVSVD